MEYRVLVPLSDPCQTLDTPTPVTPICIFFKNDKKQELRRVIMSMAMAMTMGQ